MTRTSPRPPMAVPPRRSGPPSAVSLVALMVALVQHLNIAELLLEEEFTIVKNPGEDDMEIITKKGEEISKYKQNQNTEADPSQKRGKRVGTAYQLENGEIIYIPE